MHNTEASWTDGVLELLYLQKRAKEDIFIEENNTVRKGFAPVE